MKKIKLMGCLIIALGLSFAIIPKLTDAFDFQTVCQKPLTKFSSGGSTFGISFPPGGATTCDTFPPADSNCPTVTLPFQGTVFSMKVDMASKGKEIGTPYIWVPISGSDQLAQIDTADGSEAEIARYNIGINPSRTFVIPGGDVWVANRSNGTNIPYPASSVTKLSPLTGNFAIGGRCGDGNCGKDETIYSCKADCAGNVCGDGTGTCKNGIACGNGTEDCKEYKVAGNYTTGGSGPRGVTGDIKGNVWIGNYDNGTIVKLDPASGAILQTVAVGGNPYGLIADQFGYVWISNRGSGTVQAVNINTNAISQTVSIPGPYGIGIDKEGNILVASLENNAAYKINGFGTESPGLIAAGFPVSLSGGVSTRGRGIASDLNSNIWVGSDNGASGTVYSFKPSGAAYCPFYNPAPQHNTVGVAVDFNNNIWVVPYDRYVLKLKPDNISACTAVTKVAEVDLGAGASLYNYSDMTGLRTIPKTISIAGGATIPLSPAGTFEVCADGTTTCSDATPCAVITAYLASCVPDAMNNCKVPLEIFSLQAGDYALKNLEVIYGKQTPVTTGGLIPCGREWDDPDTPWNDKAPCDLCHLILLVNEIMNFLAGLAFVIALLALIVTGFLLLTSAGNSEKINNAKTNLKWIILGIIIIFFAWFIVDFLLTAWGYIDPLGGKWDVVC